MKKVAFIIPPTVELLDLAGPVQVFTEAKFYGYEIEIEFFIYAKDPVSTCGLHFGKLKSFTKATLKEGDFIFIPGMDQQYIRTPSFRNERKFFRWLKDASKQNISVCSVCNGAFALGEAGLLKGIESTTHWRRVEELQSRFPDTKVKADVFYTKNDKICTSGGISAGIDLALSILEEMAGTPFAHKVARGLVVYWRRNRQSRPGELYHEARNHINVKIHELQDYLVKNIDRDPPIAVLARHADMSSRNLMRVFKDATGITINQYVTQIRLNTARELLKNSKNTMTAIAKRCGFKTERQLQRILKNE